MLGFTFKGVLVYRVAVEEACQRSIKQGEIRAPVSCLRGCPGSDQGEEWSHQSRVRDGWSGRMRKTQGKE